MVRNWAFRTRVRTELKALATSERPENNRTSWGRSFIQRMWCLFWELRCEPWLAVDRSCFSPLITPFNKSLYFLQLQMHLKKKKKKRPFRSQMLFLLQQLPKHPSARLWSFLLSPGVARHLSALRGLFCFSSPKTSLSNRGTNTLCNPLSDYGDGLCPPWWL